MEQGLVRVCRGRVVTFFKNYSNFCEFCVQLLSW